MHRVANVGDRPWRTDGDGVTAAVPRPTVPAVPEPDDRASVAEAARPEESGCLVPADRK